MSQEIAERLWPFEAQLKRLETIPTVPPIPTELVVCSARGAELQDFLSVFVMQVREAVEAARRETIAAAPASEVSPGP